MKRFENQVAVVTGGAQGIGYAIAARLVEEGAKVWLLDVDERLAADAAESLIEKGGAARYAALDISDESQVKQVFDEIESCGDDCSIVVNSAGIVGPNSVTIDQVACSDFERVCRVNLLGTFLVTKYALKAMLPRKYGRILLLASIAGKEGNAGMSPYSASKAGVIGLVKSAGKEFAESGITVNAIAPATIMTSMVEKMEPEQVRYMTDRIPMKRCGSLEEIASLAAWILSPEASFNTGFTFDLTGGRAVY